MPLSFNKRFTIACTCSFLAWPLPTTACFTCNAVYSATGRFVDLPLDVVGAYTMHVAIDGQARAHVSLFVRATPPFVAPGGMLS